MRRERGSKLIGRLFLTGQSCGDSCGHAGKNSSPSPAPPTQANRKPHLLPRGSEIEFIIRVRNAGPRSQIRLVPAPRGQSPAPPANLGSRQKVLNSHLTAARLKQRGGASAHLLLTYLFVPSDHAGNWHQLAQTNRFSVWLQGCGILNFNISLSSCLKVR